MTQLQRPQALAPPDGGAQQIAYVVDAENFESIHNHSAYARISRGAV
jgi:GTP cyclohydrolase FolE2